jgi:hypothetical protein
MKTLEITDHEQELLLFATQSIGEASLEAAFEQFEEGNEEVAQKMLLDGRAAQELHQKIKDAEEKKIVWSPQTV